MVTYHSRYPTRPIVLLEHTGFPFRSYWHKPNPIYQQEPLLRTISSITKFDFDIDLLVSADSAYNRLAPLSRLSSDHLSFLHGFRMGENGKEWEDGKRCIKLNTRSSKAQMAWESKMGGRICLLVS
jgi:hypothetical protein